MTATENGRKRMTTEKKKGTPEGAPSQHINGSTPLGKKQWLVDILIDLINEGHRVKRPKNGSIDRQLREIIAEKNKSGEDVIINIGRGYFRATEDDGPALREYVNKELHRADEIRDKANTILKTWERRYQ